MLELHSIGRAAGAACRSEAHRAAARHTRCRVADRPRVHGTFVLTGFEHRGVRTDAVRLAFYVAGESGLLVVWGRPRVDMRHVHALEDAIERSGFPVRVQCEWVEPDEYESRTFRHRHWVMEADHFTVLQRTAADAPVCEA